MNTRVASIIEEARKLTPEEREEFVRRLREISRGERKHRTVTVDASSIDAAQQRAAQVDRGEVELVPWEKVLAELRKC